MGLVDQNCIPDESLDVTGIKRFGIAFLDDPDLIGDETPGWASVDGEKAYRFSRLADLESDTIWINNSTYEASRRARHYSIHNLRGDSFLGSRLKAIIDDLNAGAHPNNNLTAQQLSAIARRVCLYAIKKYETQEVIASYTLGSGILNALGENRLPDTGESWLNDALTQAFQRGASCDMQNQAFLRGARTVHLRHNRLLHADRVMDLLIPNGAFEYVRASKKAMSADSLLDQERPVLAQISVSKIRPEVASILGFGNFIGSRTGRQIREWVASPELALLSEFASIKIKGAVFWEEATPLARRLHLRFDDPLLAASYSAGLIAESHLAALCMGKRNELTKRIQYSPRAVFVAAMDRVLTFPLVRALRNEGYTIINYSGGAVQIRAQSSMLSSLSAFARDAGLAFPLPEIADRVLASSNESE